MIQPRARGVEALARGSTRACPLDAVSDLKLLLEGAPIVGAGINLDRCNRGSPGVDRPFDDRAMGLEIGSAFGHFHQTSAQAVSISMLRLATACCRWACTRVLMRAARTHTRAARWKGSPHLRRSRGMLNAS